MRKHNIKKPLLLNATTIRNLDGQTLDKIAGAGNCTGLLSGCQYSEMGFCHGSKPVVD